MDHWPFFHEDAVSALQAVLIAWGPLCEKEQQLAMAMARAVKVRWEEIAPAARATAALPAASEGDGVDGQDR